jgi:hypothetical protein
LNNAVLEALPPDRRQESADVRANPFVAATMVFGVVLVVLAMLAGRIPAAEEATTDIAYYKNTRAMLVVPVIRE